MKPSLSFLLVICMIVALTGCSGVFFVGGAINPGTSSIIGVVSIVQISAVVGDSGTTVQSHLSRFSVTAFLHGRILRDQRDRFPSKSSAPTSPGQTCASIVTIVIT
jgi:hypothetical protein